jgi:hypothetical protein
VGATAPIGFDADARPEALTSQVASARRGAGHARRDQKHVDRLRRAHEAERQTVA